MSLLAGMFLITSCNGLTGPKPTSTPAPCPKDVLETTVRDFEDLRKEIDDLAALADDTPAEDLEPIVRQMTALKEEVNQYDFPLCAAKAQSALQNFSFYTEQCYFIKFMEYIKEIYDEESISDYDDYDRCDRAQLHEEAFDLMLQELNEMIAEK
jgi:hypothetical protein